ncbi:MAG: ComEC/Rec2 family competence protein [Caldilineaceae bacterium]
MRLLYAALAYLFGLAAARWWWEAAAIECQLGNGLWLIALACMPLVSLLNRGRERRPHPPMRWPEEAGFEPPERSPSPALIAGLALCCASGFLRYGSQPFTPCWQAGDLAYYNLPAKEAFDRSAQRVTVTGAVDSYPLVVDDKQKFIVASDTVQWRDHAAANGQPGPLHQAAGKVSVTAFGTARLRYGQPVSVTGRLAEPAVFEDFSYKDYLAIGGVSSVMYGAQVRLLSGGESGNQLLSQLYALRTRGEAFINRSLAEPYAALANGMLLGIEANIPAELYDQFKATGASHVIVISGTNVALISGIVIALAARLLGKRRAVWPALAAIACYALLVGGEVAVVRAAVMGGLFVTAAALKRSSTAIVSLSAACLAMTLANPLALWDIGLQLSSMATAGLVLLSPVLARQLRCVSGRFFGWTPGWLRVTGEDVVAVTLAATLATLPLGLYYSHRLSLVSLLANVLIAPVQPLILFSGTAALIAGWSGVGLLSRALLWMAWLGLAWTVGAVRWCARLPFAVLDLGAFGVPQVVAAYAMIGLVRWRREVGERMVTVAAAIKQGMRGGASDDAGASAGESDASVGAARPPGEEGTRSGGRNLANETIALPPDLVPLRVVARTLVSGPGLLVACAVAALVWATVLGLPDGRLHVWFLDVGQGDGVLIQTPAGRQILVDGGSSGQVLLGQLGAVMPFWDRTLDLVVLTHPDADHMAAQVDALGRYRVEAAWETPAAAADPATAAWRSAVEGAGAQVQAQYEGGWADLGDGVALWVLGPPGQGFVGEDADNQNSLVAKLVYGDFSVLLTGDGGTAAEQALIAQGAPVAATVLKVAHHGSKSATGASFVNAVGAPIAVIQVGADNDYGHPSVETLARLAGRMILRNDENGRIHVWSDGEQVWEEGEKG